MPASAHLNMVHVELSTPGLHLQVTKTHAFQMFQFLSTANHSGSQHLKGIYWHQRRSFVQWLVSVTLRAISEAQNAKNGTWNCSKKDVVACCSRACCLKHQNSQVFGVAKRPTCHHRSHPRQEFELHRQTAAFVWEAVLESAKEGTLHKTHIRSMTMLTRPRSSCQ